MSRSKFSKSLRDTHLSCSYFAFLAFVILASVLLVFPQNACAVDVTLAWDANSEDDLAGYRIYYREDGQSYDYDNPTWEGTDTTCTIYSLDDSTTYYFVARAFDEAGNESGDSDEVSYQHNTSPILSGLFISGSSSVNESATASYTATATFSDGSNLTVTTSATWSENSPYASISGNGVLSASEVTSDQTVTVTASYTSSGVTSTAQNVVTIVDIPESNLPPSTPVISSPYDGQMECELMPNITTEPFSDPDGDVHGQSRWQISSQEDFSSMILDVTCTKQLTELIVPHSTLLPDTTYHARVRFYDVYLEPSEWSETIEFTTAANNNDVDSNGIPDDQEVGYGLDLNGNGVDDIDEPENIKCVQTADGAYTIGISKVSDSIIAIEAVEIIDPSSISDNENRPINLSLGLFSYRITVNQVGATAAVTIYFTEPIPSDRIFFKYDTINGWENYSQHTTLNGDGRSITLEVKDGSYGDSDGLENGVIVDPGGLGMESSGDNEWQDSLPSVVNGCFITTTAWHSYTEPEIMLLTSVLVLAELMLSCLLFLRRH